MRVVDGHWTLNGSRQVKQSRGVQNMQRGLRWTSAGNIKHSPCHLTPYGIRRQVHHWNEHPNCLTALFKGAVTWLQLLLLYVSGLKLGHGGSDLPVPRPFFVLQGHIQTVWERGEVLNVIINKSRWEASTQMALKSRDWIKKFTSYNIKYGRED